MLDRAECSVTTMVGHTHPAIHLKQVMYLWRLGAGGHGGVWLGCLVRARECGREPEGKAQGPGVFPGNTHG